MVKRGVAFLLSLVLLAACFSGGWTGTAEAGKNDFMYSITEGEAKIVQYTGTQREVVIPSEVDGIPVTEIYRLSNGTETITHLTVPASIRLIQCEALDFSDGLAHIEVEAGNPSYSSRDGVLFSQDGTRLIRYPKAKEGNAYTVPDGVREIEDTSFYECRFPQKIVLPASLRRIHFMAFMYCRQLREVNLSDGITSIDSSAFSGCTSLEKIHIPDGVTTIGGGAFSGCTSLKDINIPASVYQIGHNAFEDTGYAADGSHWKDGALYYGEWLLGTSADLTGRISVRPGTRMIAYRAFAGRSVQEVVLPESLYQIGDRAFADCVDLARIVIPQNVGRLGENLFEGCERLADIFVAEGNLVYSAHNGVLFDKYKTTLIQYPNGKKQQSYTVPQGVKTIDAMAFAGNTALRDIHIPSSVTSIRESAFHACTGLTTVTLSPGLNSIEEEAFSYCSALTRIELPATVSTVGRQAFSDCSSLTQVTLSAALTTIEGYVFGCCQLLERIVVPAGVTSIEDDAFSDCQSLTSIEVEDGNQAYCSVDGVLFDKDMTALIAYPANKPGRDYTVPDGVAHLAKGAFERNGHLTEVILCEGLTSIGAFAFFGCTELVDVSIPGSVISIGASVFSEKQTSLNGWEDGALYIDGCLFMVDLWKTGEYRVKEGTRLIADRAFYVSKLTGIYLPDSVRSIGSEAMGKCYELRYVVMPDGVETIEADAFDDWEGKPYEADGLKTALIGNSGGAAQAYAVEAPYLCTFMSWGDVDGSGMVDTTDYIRIMQHFLKISPIEDAAALVAADVTGEGTIDTTDYIRVMQYFLQIIDTF